ncbi:MAG: hypothetical protein KAS32_12795, partial [Candidatus Peribacteraceae bacterium]|nr:hypothetical protein [Candidatus Peribacteraceae bacterium]
MFLEFLFSLILWIILIAAFYYFIFPKFRKNTEDALLNYVDTVENRLQGFLGIPDAVRENSESIRTLIDLMNDQLVNYEPTPGVLKTNIAAIKHAELALMKSQEEIGRLHGEKTYLEGYVGGVQTQTAMASNRLGRAIHDVPLEMLEKVQIVRDRHSEGSSSLRKRQVRAELAEERDKVEDRTLRSKQKESLAKKETEEEMEEVGNGLDTKQKRVARAIEKELKEINKRNELTGELDAKGIKKLPTK